ncbi:AAA family ATPase [Mycobacteroides abscessus subsp. bolletii]|uniref:AAA family ATPase n=1 Tax=Mycobacteroides abscessus TaxID=36809 RepID=UPI0019D1E734|nr:AAA family ATPase [Mycobacteroides abscessus]MBN7300447.1 AAA family ATPase [Mycobacteroides abscessus subsp. bolletii]
MRYDVYTHPPVPVDAPMHQLNRAELNAMLSYVPVKPDDSTDPIWTEGFQEGLTEGETLFETLRQNLTVTEYDSLLDDLPLSDPGLVAKRLKAKVAEIAARTNCVAVPAPAVQQLGQLLTVGLSETETPATAASTGPAGDRYIDGGSFVLDIPDTTPAVWGRGDDVLWAEGEGAMIAGPQGVGKTTLAGLLVRGLLVGGDVLGYPVKGGYRVLYLAMDRPRQIARALRRQLGDLDREVLAEKLVVWQGPPLSDLAKQPQLLLDMAFTIRANVVVVDSLKDAAIGLSNDEVGAGWNRARQALIAHGGQILELHHTRKSTPGGDSSSAVDMIYGSTWLTSGLGSIIHLSGEPGDPIVKLRHLKQPANDVGPLEILHDGSAGSMSLQGAVDLIAMAREAYHQHGTGIVAAAAAARMHETDHPNKNDIEKARRKLEGYVKSGRLRRNGKHSQTGAVFYAPTGPTPL